MARVTARRSVLHVDDGVATRRPDAVAVEEPLEIRLRGQALAVTMRTPGNDFDLVAGFTWTEGVLAAPTDLGGLRYCSGTDDDGRNTYNVIDVVLAPDAVEKPLPERYFSVNSACGVCGKASIDAVRVRSPFDLADDATAISSSVLATLPERLRSAQKVFDRTGGLHAAGLFDASGELLVLREDVGRHNAVDKVVGWAVREGRLPLRGCALMVSGRVSFELVQKASLAGIPVIAAVSAPSSLAVEFAESVAMTLVGFVRGTSMNVYAGEQRVSVEPAASPAVPVAAS